MADGDAVDELHRVLQQQLDELELLQSMFSSPGEFQVDDQPFLDQITYFLSGLVPGVPTGRIGYSLHVLVDAPGCAAAQNTQHTVHLSVKLPHSYPNSHLPEVYVRSDALSREAQDCLNSDLQLHMNSSIQPGDVCVLTILDWVQNNSSSYFPILVSPDSHTSKPHTPDSHFCRMWLYMHHIYNKTKRKDILYYAHELGLTGFCLPGKPGVVCVEGDERQTKEFYDILRRWNWKSITCRKREVSSRAGDIDAQRRISGFEELVFDLHGTRQNHVDMGQFLEYLRAHNLDYMFKELFGVDGRSHGDVSSAVASKLTK